MKRLLTVLCLVMCLAVMVCLASCQGDVNEPDETKADETKTQETEAETTVEDKKPEPATAMELWELVDKKMESANSYECDGTLDMIFYMNGFKFESKATAVQVMIGDEEKEDYYSYEFTKSEMSCDELSMKQTINAIQAYNEGYAFYSKLTDGNGNSFCSKMTPVEFEEHFSSSVSEDFEYGDCTKAEYKKNDDGTWTLSFSGYTKKAVGVFLKDIGMEDGELGADILDMNITMTANSDFYAIEIILEFVFDVEETDTAIPVLKQVQKYNNFDAATKITDTIKKDEYTEVADLRVIQNVEDALNDFAAAAEGSFTLDVKQEMKDSADSVVINEKDTVSFGKKNGGYFYVADCILSGQNVSITYKSGVQTITIGEETQNLPQTEEEAKDYVAGVLNSAAYSVDLISGMEKVKDGVYKLAVSEPDTEKYEAYLANYGITLKSATQEIVVTFDGDTLKSMESEVKILAEYTENGVTEGVDMNVYTLLTLNTQANPEQNF